MKKTLLLTGLLATISVSAFAYGGSNLPNESYPKFTYHLEKANPSLIELALYQDDIQTYLNQADSDIQRILDAKADAVREYNKRVQEYNKRNKEKKALYY